MKESIKKDVETLWEFLCLDTKEEKADCIIGLGSILRSVPLKCAELYNQKLGNYIIFSGNCGKGTEGIISKTEAEIFEDIAISANVPKKDILTENKATNTYENFKYIKQVLEENKLNPQSFLIVGKPYQERRAQAIANIELASKTFRIASFKIDLDSFLEYVQSNGLMSVDDVINEIVAEVNIALVAPKYGVQSAESLSEAVLLSYQNLINAGYNRYLIDDEVIKAFLKKWEYDEALINPGQ